ncbi:MAG TPA: Holliday junction resolvase RuvX [Acidimicrobiia bacterium]|nr:Holliday junction resolvase RuvX [Acidimicrobiia bacterium]
MLAFDPGSTRIGVAVSDPLRILATPLEVFPIDETDDRVRALVEEYRPTSIVVGLPVGLSGREGPAAVAAREFGRRVEALVGVEVHYVDERFTTATAEAAMLEGGVRRRDRRRNVDKVAAAVILRQFLDRLDRSDRDRET